MIKLERAIDKYIGGALCLGWSFLKQKNPLKREEIKEILIVRLWTLGETLLTLPMIEKVRHEFPNARITVLARNRNKGIFKYFDNVDDVILLEKENLGQLHKLRKHYDLVIDTEPYLRVSGLLARFLGKWQIGFDHAVRGRLYSQKVHYDDSQHAAEIFCDLLTPLGIDFKPEKLVPLKVSTSPKKQLENIIGDRLDHIKVIGMHVSTAESAEYRAWPLKNFAELADKIIDRDPKARVVLTGTRGEYSRNEKVRKMCQNKNKVFNLAGLLSFEDFIGLFELLDCYVSNDTGPMHLSASQGCKTIGLFGPNLPKRFGPFPMDGSTNCAFYHGEKLPCSPCINVHTGEFKKCRRMKCGTGECMTFISVDEVLEKV